MGLASVSVIVPHVLPPPAVSAMALIIKLLQHYCNVGARHFFDSVNFIAVLHTFVMIHNILRLQKPVCVYVVTMPTDPEGRHSTSLNLKARWNIVLAS